MKNILIFSFIIFSSSLYAQKTMTTDSTYFLLDTAITPKKDRLWEIHMEYPSLKVFTVKCPCLLYNRYPTFVYNINDVKTGYLTKKQIAKIETVDIATLLKRAKEITSSKKQNRSVFIIEPNGKKFIYHKVKLLNPTKPRDPSVDFELITPPDSIKNH